MHALASAALPQHMAERIDLYLGGALVCVVGGLALLIAAVIVLKVHSRRAAKRHGR